MRVFQFLFWALVGCALIEAVLAGIWFSPRFRRGGLFTLALCSACLALAACTAAWMWSVWGGCLLPHPGEVAYRPGMTLCPGQSTSVPLIITTDPVTTPDAGREL